MNRDAHVAAQGHIGDLIRGWRRHADLSRRRFMEVERHEALELLDEIERLRNYVAVVASGMPREDLLAIEREFGELVDGRLPKPTVPLVRKP